jgi:hypothetical protein
VENIFYRALIIKPSNIDQIEIKMSLSIQIMDEIAAMRAKDTVALESLRAIKAEILLAQTVWFKGGNFSQTKLNCFKN